jgi:hypothetical protein
MSTKALAASIIADSCGLWDARTNPMPYEKKTAEKQNAP